MQPHQLVPTGSITVTWSPYDFVEVGNTGGTNCEYPATYEASCTFNFTWFIQTETFSVDALHNDPDAVVTVTAYVGGEEASAQFPVAITGQTQE